MNYLERGSNAFEENDYFESIEMYSKAAVTYQGVEKLLALKRIAESYYRLEIFDKALQRLNELCSLGYSQLDLYEINNFIAIIYGQQGLYDKSCEKYEELLCLALDNAQKYQAYVGLGLNTYYLSKEKKEHYLLEKANEFYERAMEYSTENERGIIYNNVALLYQEKNDHQTALEYFYKASEFLKDLKKRRAELKNGQAYSYLILKEYEKSMVLLDEAFFLFKELGEQIGLGRNEKIRGLWFKQNGDLYQAVFHFKNASNILQDKMLYKEVAEISYELGAILKKEDPDKAMLHLLDFAIYGDKLRKEGAL